MNIERYNRLENQFYDYFSQVSKLFNDPDGFINFLVNDTGFFDSPLTISDAYNYRSGLLEYSLTTTKTLIDLNYFIADKKYTIEKCILVSLFSKLKLSYINRTFPFIWVLGDNIGYWTNNTELYNVDKEVYKSMYPYIDKEKFVINNNLQLLLQWAGIWSKLHGQNINYSIVGEELEL